MLAKLLNTLPKSDKDIIYTERTIPVLRRHQVDPLMPHLLGSHKKLGAEYQMLKSLEGIIVKT